MRAHSKFSGSARRWIAVAPLFVVGWLGAAAPALALPVYPGLIDNSLGVDCGLNSSRCLACHATAAGGRNTAIRPFALTLQDYGFGRDSSLAVLTDLLQTSAMDRGSPATDGALAVGAPSGGDLSTEDSDEDGISDIEELLDCRNPSGEEYGVPEYGCDGGSIAGSTPPSAGWIGLGLLALGLGRRKRPSRASRQSSLASQRERGLSGKRVGWRGELPTP